MTKRGINVEGCNIISLVQHLILIKSDSLVLPKTQSNTKHGVKKMKMLKSLISKLKTAKAEYLKRSPKGKWKFVQKIGIMVLRCSGICVLDPNFKVNWWSYAGAVVILDVTISFFWSIWYYNYKENNPVKVLFNIPLYFGILIPVSQML